MLNKSSIIGLRFSAAGLIALADIKTISNRTAFTGTASFLDVLFISPGIHCQQAASQINKGEYPTTGALTSGYVFRVENQATVGFLQKVGQTGCLVCISVSRPCPSRTCGTLFATGLIPSAIYLCGIALTVAVTAIMGTIHDWWGLLVLGMLMLARFLNVVIIKRRARIGWKGAPEPGVRGDLLILLSQDRWIRMRGLVDDLKAVTSGQWLKDATTSESYCASFTILLVFTAVALTVNVSTIGGVLIASLLLASAALLGLCNALTPNLQMFGRIVSQDGPAKPYKRRLELANELIEETGRDDWAIGMGISAQHHLHEVLNPAKMDLSVRVACLEGTRRNVIDPILQWADDLSSKTNMYWLSGDPGLGKSAIANSVAEERSVAKGHQGLCVAYLFFDRNDPTSSDPNLVIRTIAYKLASNNTYIRVAIRKAIELNPKIATESLATQFTKLLYEPLTACQDRLGSPLLIILDALDECGDANTRRVLVDLMANKFTLLPPQVKFFITSRLESDIVGPLTTSPIDHPINRVELLPSTEDVLRFLEVRMRKIRDTRLSSRLPVDWPGRPTMLKLSRYMEGVFIRASTVVSFVENAFHPPTNIDYLLMSNNGNSTERLGCLFASVLQSVGDWKDANFVDKFRDIVGAVVVERVPMTILAIDQLLGLKRSSSTILFSLRFLIRYRENQPIRTLHASVAEYITDPERSGRKPWFINISDRHRFLTRSCLRLMKERLRFNICGLKTSHLLNKDVPGLRQRVQKSVPGSLAYACQHFATHLDLCNMTPSNFDNLDSFMHSQLLFWLEALSLVGETHVVKPVMEILEHWYRNNNEELADLANDVVEFMAVFQRIVCQSTPHLYISAVPMWREGSQIRRMYGQKFKGTVRTNHAVDPIPSLQSIVTEHPAEVPSTGFLLNGNGFVPGSVMGGRFVGHTSSVTSVGFSADGKRVVSGSCDNTVRIWDADTGSVVVGPLEGHTSMVRSAGFSPDGTRVVSGSEDNTVLIWDAQTGSLLAKPFAGHTSTVTSVGFSPDGKRVVSGSSDNTVRIWDVETGSLVAGPFEGHTDWVTSVEFSPDGTRVVSGSSDKTVRIWDVKKGCVAAGPFKGHSQAITSVKFSPDGKRVVSGSEDKTMRIWNTRRCSIAIRPSSFIGHTSSVTSVGFSPDGQCVVSGSSDKTVRIWDAKTRSLVARPFKGHTEWVTSVGFSPNGKRIVSGSNDNTVRIWDAETGSLVVAPHQLPIACTWRLHDDGWLRSPSDALVLWIPYYYPRAALCLPPATVVIGVERIQFDLSFVHGVRWTECFDQTM